MGVHKHTYFKIKVWLYHVLSRFSRVQLFVTLWRPPGSSIWDSSGKNTGVGCHFPLQGIFGTQGLNPRLLRLLHYSWLQQHQFSSVQFSRSVVSDSLRPHELQHARPPCPSPTPGVHSNSRPSCWWCHPAISSSVILFSSCLQSFPEAGSFLRSWFFTSGGQSNRVLASASVLAVNKYSGLISFRIGWLDLLAVQGTLKVFSNTTVQKHQSLALSFLYSAILTAIHDYWKNHSFD